MNIKVMWVDDEIEMLEPHCIFLENKGFDVIPVNNASEALEMLNKEDISVVLLDENMPGIGGLEALQKIKEIKPYLPVIMITKNEEESIMEEAIGSKISDYILKPVNPNQILLSLKKIFQKADIIEKKTVLGYQSEFRNISMELMNVNSYKEWVNLYMKLIQWDLKFDNLEDDQMGFILNNQKEEANLLFCKFIEKNYNKWLTSNDKPIMSHTIFKDLVTPIIKKNDKVLLLVVDNLRFDQWKTIEPLFKKYFKKSSEQAYFSILPTATQYARNSFFSGLLPLEIEKQFPEYWKNDPEEGNKNTYEEQLLERQLQRLGLGYLKSKYIKILNSEFEQKVCDDFKSYKSYNFISIVYNFIDILSHAKTNNNIVNELIRDDKTFRSLAYNWFKNAPIMKIIKQASENGYKVVVTTDHGTIYVKKPIKIIGDKESSTNLRYKLGKNLQYDSKEVFSVNNPEKYFLPRVNVNSKYIFARENTFFAYPKNYNHFVNYYKNTYQHGGISLEEIIIPFIVLE